MRPDILLFEKSPDDSLPMSVQRLEQADNRRSCKVHVIEVGFCTEISYFQKFKRRASSTACSWNISEMQDMQGCSFIFSSLEAQVECSGLLPHI